MKMRSSAVAPRRTASARRLGSLLVALLVCGLPATALAQNAQRSVEGRVVNSEESPLPNAIVYLSDSRTMSVESYITQTDGAYRFEQLSPGDDYKLWAQLDGRKSRVRTLSSFDERSVFHANLKIAAGR